MKQVIIFLALIGFIILLAWNKKARRYMLIALLFTLLGIASDD